MRFGTVSDTEEDVVAELLERRQVELARLLRELDGQVELNVRATYDEERLLAEIVQANPRIARLRAATRELPGGIGLPLANPYVNTSWVWGVTSTTSPTTSVPSG